MMRKISILILILITGFGFFLFKKNISSTFNKKINIFEIRDGVVVDQKDFMANKNIQVPITNGLDAINVVMAGTDVLRRMVVYRQTKMSHLVWEAVAKKINDGQWLVVVREKGENANYGCFTNVAISSAEPSGLQCSVKSKNK